MPSPSKTAATSAALFPKREEGKNDTNKDHLPLKFLDCLKIFKSQRKNVVIFLQDGPELTAPRILKYVFKLPLFE